jgi:hypothetical protein
MDQGQEEIPMSWQPKAGHCYEDALMILTEGRYDKENSTCFLVHGYPHLKAASGGHEAGTKYGHAWIERDTDFNGIIHTECISVFPYVILPRDMFYFHGEIDQKEVVRYAKGMAQCMALMNDNNGPWDESPEDAVFREVAV